MCGIAGFAGVELPQGALCAAAAAMHHRGPDAEGSQTLGDISFVFRRLSIIDLSPAGNQPMSNEDGRIVMVFNGEIYNYRELRALLQANHRFSSQTDTEVLLHGYEEWGIDGLLQRIDGMFAFALWDDNLKQLHLARDRVGKKPLYYSELNGVGGRQNGKRTIAFASTLNALRELLPQAPAIDPVALDEYLVYQAVPAPRTIYAGVCMLPPAHYAQWTAADGLSIRRYWRLSYAHKRKNNEAALLDELDSLLRGAVQRRLIADVPLGAFLSGGVDSSLVVGIMSALGAGPVESVIVGFDDPMFDERRYAREVAARWKANLHEYLMPARELELLPEIVWHYGQPLADVSIVPTYAAARAARKHVTVALNGDGADEAFGGYSRPMVARAAQAFRETVPAFLQPLARTILPAGGKKGRMLKEAVRGNARDAFVYDRGLRDVREAVYAPEFLETLGQRHPDALYHEVWDQAAAPTDADRTLYAELTTYLPDQLLVKMDVSTMAHSLEARSPFLDTRLLEFAAAVPASQLTRGYQTKYLLKRLAERYVPKRVIYRRKRGFVMPATEWLRGELAPHVRRLLLSPEAAGRSWFRRDAVEKIVEQHLSGHRDFGNILWTLLVFEIWHRLFVDRSMTRDYRLT